MRIRYRIVIPAYSSLSKGLILSPSQVVGLVATPGDTTVALAWTAIGGVSLYNVYRGTSSGAETLLTTSATNSYNDTGLSNGTTYYYKVAGVVSGQVGVLSAEVTGAPVAAGPPVAGYALWLDAAQTIYSDSGTTPVTNGGNVQQWNDLSGNSNHFRELTNRPTYNTTGIGGKPSVHFNGTSSILTSLTSFALGSTSDAFVVLKLHDSPGSSTVILGATNSIVNYFLNYGSGTTDMYVNGQQAGPAYTIDTPFVLESRVNGASGRIRHNTTTVNVTNQVRSGTGMIIGGGQNFMSGDIAEVIFYASPLSDADSTLTRNYLVAKYTIS